jgi:hypothetical protein
VCEYTIHVCVHTCVCMHVGACVYMMYVCMYVCRPSPSNQSLYRLIAGYQRGAGGHRVGKWWEGLWAYKLVVVP